MHIEIKNKVSGSVIYQCEVMATSPNKMLGLAVAMAIKDGVNLEWANLSRVNLEWANLVGSNLVGANLSGANLSGANLSRANLELANLSGANLELANLSGANLELANLSGANLVGANLSGANLSGANLHEAKNYNPYRINPLLIFYDQPGPIIFAKLVNAEGQGIFKGGITYNVGESYEVEKANTDPYVECGEGINVATYDWCLRHWWPGYRILLIETKAQDIACIPYNSDGKIRLFRGKVIGEKNIHDLKIHHANNS